MSLKRLIRKINRSFGKKLTSLVVALGLLIIVPTSIYLIFTTSEMESHITLQENVITNSRGQNLSSCPQLIIKNTDLNNRISLGNKTLIGEQFLIPDHTDMNRNKKIQLSVKKKQAGTQAFAQGNCEEAKKLFAEAKNIFPNDPENIIYLHNVQVGSNPLKIAVSVPIGNQPPIAQEILRGVAYAQYKINETGINNRKLLVEIINDDNDSAVVKKVAEELVKDATILAVIGHNTSKASLAAAPFYNDQLVMVSPTSTSDNLSNYNKFIFRSVFTNREMTKTLAKYAVKTINKNPIAVCYAHDDPSSKSFTVDFRKSVNNEGGKTIEIDCNLSSSNFNAVTAVSQAINLGANGLFIDPEINQLNTAINLANVNNGRLVLFGEPTLYTKEILQGQVEGLVLVAPWHPDLNPSFAQNMQSFWGGPVNWRTGMAYDATQAIIAGLQQKQTRQGLQQVLGSREFTAQGENGEIKFDYDSGDRLGTVVLVTVSNKNFKSIPVK